jgi:hypothetical protein
MFHWCPEETAAVIAAGTAAALSLVWFKARWFIFVGWLRRKLGIEDKRHCCLHPVPNRAGTMTKAELLLSIEQVIESFDAVKKADRVFRIEKQRDFRPGQQTIRLLNPMLDGLEPQDKAFFTRTYRLPEEEALATPCRVCHCPKFGGQIHDERTTCQYQTRAEDSK